MTDETESNISTITPEVPQKTPKMPKKALKTSVFLIVNSQYPIVEPFTNQRFNPGVTTETSEITQWLQYQIDAGLMEVVQC